MEKEGRYNKLRRPLHDMLYGVGNLNTTSPRQYIVQKPPDFAHKGNGVWNSRHRMRFTTNAPKCPILNNSSTFMHGLKMERHPYARRSFDSLEEMSQP